jgi:hypothetical protein
MVVMNGKGDYSGGLLFGCCSDKVGSFDCGVAVVIKRYPSAIAR